MIIDNLWFQVSFWIFSILLFITIEAITNQLVSVWFSLGSLLALISISFLNSKTVDNNLSILFQFLIFFFSSLITFIPFIFYFKKRSVIDKFQKSDIIYSDLYLLEQDTSEHNEGKLTIKDIPYSCLPYNPKEKIFKGQMVKIVAFKGNIALVKKGEQ